MGTEQTFLLACLRLGVESSRRKEEKERGRCVRKCCSLLTQPLNKPPPPPPPPPHTQTRAHTTQPPHISPSFPFLFSLSRHPPFSLSLMCPLVSSCPSCAVGTGQMSFFLACLRLGVELEEGGEGAWQVCAKVFCFVDTSV